jgi:hypothetical protein
VSDERSLLELAEILSSRLAEDIQLARTRDEHIRVTARANEAAELLTGLQERLSNP